MRVRDTLHQLRPIEHRGHWANMAQLAFSFGVLCPFECQRSQALSFPNYPALWPHTTTGNTRLKGVVPPHTPTGICIFTKIRCLGVVGHFDIDKGCQRSSLWYWGLPCSPRLSHIMDSSVVWSTGPEVQILWFYSPSVLNELHRSKKLFGFFQGSFPCMWNGNNAFLLHLIVWKCHVTGDALVQKPPLWAGLTHPGTPTSQHLLDSIWGQFSCCWGEAVALICSWYFCGSLSLTDKVHASNLHRPIPTQIDPNLLFILVSWWQTHGSICWPPTMGQTLFPVF